jgi:hypothetical protein
MPLSVQGFCMRRFPWEQFVAIFHTTTPVSFLLYIYIYIYIFTYINIYTYTHTPLENRRLHSAGTTFSYLRTPAEALCLERTCWFGMHAWDTDSPSCTCEEPGRRRPVLLCMHMLCLYAYIHRLCMHAHIQLRNVGFPSRWIQLFDMHACMHTYIHAYIYTLSMRA